MRWQDLTGPQRDQLTECAGDWKLPRNLIEDSLDPEHLPKIEKFPGGLFIILRSFDPHSADDADEVQALTRKLALFVTDQGILSVHRTEQFFVTKIKAEFPPSERLVDKKRQEELLTQLILGSLATFSTPIDQAIEKLNRLEEETFVHQEDFRLEDAYYLRRRIATFRRIFRLNQEIMTKLSFFLEHCPNHIQEIRDELDSLTYYSDETFENLNTLLQLHISLSSQKINEATYRTGEVVRVLTIFSVFLLPLNLVTGIYGMNFVNMPELNWSAGYPFALGLMISIVILIYLWFHRQGWLR